MKSVGCNDKSKQTAFKQEAQFKEFFPENVKDGTQRVQCDKILKCIFSTVSSAILYFL